LSNPAQGEPERAMERVFGRKEMEREDLGVEGGSGMVRVRVVESWVQVKGSWGR
jgi:hypothetical protein